MGTTFVIDAAVGVVLSLPMMRVLVLVLRRLDWRRATRTRAAFSMMAKARLPSPSAATRLKRLMMASFQLQRFLVS